MANQDGNQIPITEDDMGEGFRELWEDYSETYPESHKKMLEDLIAPKDPCDPK